MDHPKSRVRYEDGLGGWGTWYFGRVVFPERAMWALVGVTVAALFIIGLVLTVVFGLHAGAWALYTSVSIIGLCIGLGILWLIIKGFIWAFSQIKIEGPGR